jgi:endoglucanase
VSAQDAVWADWASAFVAPDGRVVDALQGGISHSEGQGYGMVLATAAGDEVRFEVMSTWTEAHLAVRQDPLLAWRWRPDEPAKLRDYNNASDGDLFYAWALLRGARRWGRADLAERAGVVSRALTEICIAGDPRGEGELLIPAAEHFATPEGLVVNPSYWMPLAMHELAAAFDLPRLAAAAEHGTDLLWDAAVFGPVPDWIEVTAAGWRPHRMDGAAVGYEAIRVPLWLVWSGRPAHPAVRRILASSGPSNGPTIGDVGTGSVLNISSDPGYRSVLALAECTQGRVAEQPAFTASQSYYPATLHALAFTAAREANQACT